MIWQFICKFLYVGVDLIVGLGDFKRLLIDLI